MSGTTFTFVGTASPSDWNTASNWTPNGTFPNDPTAVAIDTAGYNLVISGGNSDTVASLTIGTGATGVFVGASDFTGTLTGGGTLTAGTINQSAGVLVGSPAGTITATTATLTDAGGGGTFNIGTIVNNGRGLIANNGNDATLGTLILNGNTITGTGSIEVQFVGSKGSSLTLNEATSQNIHVADISQTFPNTQAATITLDQPTGFGGTIVVDTPAQDTVDLNLAGGAVTSPNITQTGNAATLTVTQGGSTETFHLFSGDGSNFTLGTNLVVAGVVCFARGTRIATPEGEVAVESLKEGDLVLTQDGAAKPVKWVGRRLIDCRRHPEANKVWPVRVAAGAFGENLPRRDLYVSPQHAVYAEGVLIPARMLINGSTVTQVRVDSVDYFHVELERHDIVLAEGLPSESYLDTGDRASFENAGGAMVLHPDFSRWAWDARACADLKVTGPELERVRAQLAERAKAPVRREAIAAAG
jgi:hypothetical protein